MEASPLPCTGPAVKVYLNLKGSSIRPYEFDIMRMTQPVVTSTKRKIKIPLDLVAYSGIVVPDCRYKGVLMAGIIQVSEAASIGVHATLWMAKTPGKLARSSEVCRMFGFSEAHFAKVMQSLSRSGIVESVRGPRGGTRLARSPAAITLLEVFEAIEGNLTQDRCLLSPRFCPARCCPIGHEIDSLNRRLRQTLADATLESMCVETDWSGFVTPSCASVNVDRSGKRVSKRKKRKGERE